MRARVADELTLSELLKGCLERPPDDAAWEEFVLRFHPAIKASVGKIFRLKASQETERRQFSDDLIEDLVQVVYLRLIEQGNRALRRFEGEHENSMFSYLSMISTNVVRDHFREAKAQKRPRVSFSLDELLENTGEGGMLKGVVSSIDGKPITGSNAKLSMEDIEKALKQAVSVRHKERDCLIFQLRYQEGLTLDEIKRALGLDISAIGIGSILNRINARLRSRLIKFVKNPVRSGRARPVVKRTR